MKTRYDRYGELRFDRPLPGVLRITLAGTGRRGAMNVAMHRELSEVWRDVGTDPDVRSVLLTADGPDLSAGGDLDDQLRGLDDHAHVVRTMEEARDIVTGILDCPRPVVTAARGWAVGAGLALLVLADVSIAADDARLLDGHLRIGLAAGDHAAISWPQLCGVAKAKYHLLLNEPLSGAEAERIGLIALSVPDDELDDRALRLADRLARLAPAATRWTKRTINHAVRDRTPAFDASLALETLGVLGPEGREGIAAFVEKRRPDWG